MRSTDLVNNSIRKELSEQREKLSILENQVDELNADIETHKIIITGLELSLSQHPAVTSVDNKSDLARATPATQVSNLPNISKEYTLAILKKSDHALHGNEIAQIYEREGVVENGKVSTHGKVVREHLCELVKSGLIYQTNPGAQRSMRYKPVDGEADDLISTGFNSSPLGA